MTQFQENACTDKGTEGQTEAWKDGVKDRQTLFYRILPAISGGPKTRMQNIVS